MQEKTTGFERALAHCDVVKASRLLTEIYEIWDEIEEKDQENIKSLEPVYLTIVKAEMGTTNKGEKNA